ncbi:hypothetical protein BGZ83_009285 [Gryganskiella cystojenkinii]|nr:hypothetical protein BGZ83_009285 [Gryganskiella cystojenkinii]
MRIQWEDLKVYDTIGSGSFGKVFHGDLLGTEVAIKECVRSESKAFDDKYYKREVDILRQARHPNIVQFMGICKRKKRFYIITEFLPLGNLRRWIQDETKEFGWDTRISFAIDISLALAYLHHKNIIHRDLKGENLLISDNMRIKVCDFGFSRVAAKDEDEMRRISYCGTDGYMAPEILLGEDFDCSVDVFSFGIVLAEMMARHVVDPNHFQRHPPDMTVSPDEILYRSQPGCPLELSELAIHCVQGLPEDRPKLRQVVERLTAIENVDIHVGTTLVVAPSVARAARNMMRKKETSGKTTKADGYPTDLQPHRQQQQQNQQRYPEDYENNSSLQGVANTWRMTDEENRYSTSRMTESRVIGSQSTFKGIKRRVDNNNSTIPLVLGNGVQQLQFLNDHQTLGGGSSSQGSQESSEDGMAFRMPLWDSINSPENQNRLQRWHESESVHVSTVKGTTQESIMSSWDKDSVILPIRKASATARATATTGTDNGGHHPRRSHTRYGYRGDIDFESGSESDPDSLSEEDDDGVDSLLYEDDEDEDDDALFSGGTPGAKGTYQLSSDSDVSMSSAESLTDSVVMALDMLEIPDLLMASLPQPNQGATLQDKEQEPSMRELVSGSALRKGKGIRSSDDIVKDQSTVRGEPVTGPISRLLPPIPTSENPWTVDFGQGGPAEDPTTAGSDHSSIGTTKTAKTTPPTPPAKTSSLLVRVNTWRSTRQEKEPLGLILADPDPEQVVIQSEDESPQSKNSLPVPEPVTSSAPLSQSSAVSSSLSSSPTSSNTSSTNGSIQSPEKTTTTAATSLATSPKSAANTSTTGGGGRGLGLVRGMSDSFWSLRSTSPPPATTEFTTVGVIGSSASPLALTPEGTISGVGTLLERSGTVISDTIAAAVATTTMTIGGKTWNNGTGTTTGFAQWIGQYTNAPPVEEPTSSLSDPKTDTIFSAAAAAAVTTNGATTLPALTPALAVPISNRSPSPLAANRVKTSLLKRHLSLKDKKSPEQQQPAEDGTLGEAREHPQPLLIRRRNTTSTANKRSAFGLGSSDAGVLNTGFPHRFSLVVFSTQLLPKCDVCEKRLGVLPGWSSKHLECDDCGYRTHPKCAANVAKCCTSARKSSLWDIDV